MKDMTAYDSITPESVAREIERLREKAGHDEAQALYHAKQVGWQEGWQIGWQKGWQEGWQIGWQKGWQEGWQIGWQKGWQAGIQEGISQRNVEVAQKLLAAGEPVERVMRYTGLTRQEVEECGGR